MSEWPSDLTNHSRLVKNHSKSLPAMKEFYEILDTNSSLLESRELSNCCFIGKLWVLDVSETAGASSSDQTYAGPKWMAFSNKR